MSNLLKVQRTQDLAKLFCFIAAILGSICIFAMIPILFYSTLIALTVVTVISPFIVILERRGFSRNFALIFVSSMVGVSMALFLFWGLRMGIMEWDSFKQSVPQSFQNLVSHLKMREAQLKLQFPDLDGLQLTAPVEHFGENTRVWFSNYGLSMASQFLTLAILVPIISIILLKDGRRFQVVLLSLVPNSLFESCFLVFTEITKAISSFVRAKLLESVIVGFLVTLGLFIIGAPSAGILGLIAGATNMVPYIGPLLGFVPALLVAGSVQFSDFFIVGLLIVYVFANLVDMVFLFPIFVGKLIKLHPFVLIGAVIVGQKYYGLIGMIISVPIAASLKIIFREIYIAIYQQRLPSEGWHHSEF